MTVGVRNLKNGLSRYLERVKRGEQIVVTERGKPVALLKNIESADLSDSLEARLERAAAQGLLALPKRKRFISVKPVRAAGRAASRMIVEDRR
jgi:prevent-host-death family protein